ncbi:MAG: hypothetical protein PHC34_05705 [Candidatus Gastranaerophilales bacterium]|nr:hypothetical protein [Candidatus Gastranaerophilales bacterium]
MLKPLISTLVVAAGISLSAVSNTTLIGVHSSAGAELYETIEVISNQSPNINYYPRTLHVNQGDTVHLTIKNARTDFTRFFMPAFNIDQEIPKNGIAKIDLCVTNPTAKNMWFEINSLTAKKVPGLMIVENYQTPVTMCKSRCIDVTALNDIINYSKNYCYLEKESPRYKTPSGVRGYW